MWRKRRRIILKAGIVGALIMALFTGAMLFFCQPFRNLALKGRQITEKAEVKTAVYRLKKSMAEGSLINENCIEKIWLAEKTVGRPVSYDEIIGKRVRISLNENTFVTGDLLYEEGLSKDLRLHNFSYVRLNQKIRKGSFIDVRISFPNGADFVVLSKKKVKDFAFRNQEEGKENELWMEVSEEELLRIGSAAVDAWVCSGSYLYAVNYVDEAQEGAVVTYPVNETVQKLISADPNIIEKAVHVNAVFPRTELPFTDNGNQYMQESFPETSPKTEERQSLYQEEVQYSGKTEYLD